MGPLDSSFIKIANIGINQERMTTIIKMENNKSKTLFIILFAVSSNGMFLNDTIGI